MGEHLSMPNISLFQLRLYYLFVFLSFFYLLYKYNKSIFSIFVILLFYNGLFSFLGKDIQNVYRIVIVIISIFFLSKTNTLFPQTKSINIFLSFLIFTLIFLLSCYINADPIFISFSQYSRYFVLYVAFTILYKYQSDIKFKLQQQKLIYQILIIQVILSGLKLIIIRPTEFIVGSVGSEGGALATPLPIMAFIFYWIYKNGRFKSKDWLIIVAFMFIGFMSQKRAIWFIMPIIILLFTFYIPKQKIPRKVLLFSIFAVPIVFYLGVRFSPTLNKEGVFGGSFDSEYAINYAQEYMFGKKEIDGKGTGRGGATLLLFEKITSGNLTKNDLFGYGLRYMYATDYAEFQELDFGISTKGAATGYFQNYVTSGFFGIAATLIFVFSLINKTRNKRIRNILLVFFAWEYFFYTGVVIRESCLYFLLIYFVVYSNEKVEVIISDKLMTDNGANIDKSVNAKTIKST